ncbi:MAG: lysophospholipid acyltransferase family protein [Candidatus Caenarcaniphilales bacterium]|nr:lysophospholipid acyltransferase family protein [Candidatus Caenarcaniphilales bacterium]
MSDKDKEEIDYYDSFHGLSHLAIIYGLLYPYYFLRYRTQIHGQEHVPTPGQPFIIVCNHFSYSDPTIISMALRKPVAYVGKKELFDGQKKWFSDLITFLGAIPINREKPGASSLKAIKKILLEKKWPVGIFIEGTRNQSREALTKLETGAAFMAKLGGGLPVLPVGIKGGQKSGDKLEINVGSLIPFDSKLSLEEMTVLYGRAVSELAGLRFDFDGF